MKVLFLIQGEGNGHLTQAISLFQALTHEGHEVVAAMIGSSGGTKQPDFFRESVSCPIYTYKSAGLSYSASGRLLPGSTAMRLIKAIPDISRSLRYIHSIVCSTSPDLIVNFYEVCGGLYNVIFPNKTPVGCIAHQYLFSHPDFRFPPHKSLHRFGLKLLNKVTSFKASAVYALSFSESYASTKKLRVVPPLLRREVIRLQASEGDHILVYITQPLLRGQIEKWHRRNPSIKLHCFCNNPLQKTDAVVDDSLTFHPTDTDTFLRLLSSCRALVTTAGFETVCEAMFLGKPVMMVPLPNHYEQGCNALDATASGIGVVGKNFNLDLLINYLPGHKSQAGETRKWIEKTPSLLIRSLVSLVKMPA